MAFDWDVDSPGDTDVVSQFPANERAARAAARGAFNAEHDADGTGGHKVITLSQQSDPSGTAGLWKIWQASGGAHLRTRNGTGSVLRIISLVPGTKQLWPQAAPPTGWTLDTDVTDRVIRVNSTAGGGTGGSWTITGLTADPHTHLVSGNTGAGGSGTLVDGYDGGAQAFPAAANHTHGVSITSDVANVNGVTHAPGWRPLYLDVCKATLD